MIDLSPADEEARARITAIEREAKAMAADPNAALLFHQIGQLWEDPLKNPRNAAVAYQAAFKLAPKFLANIRAARRLFAEVGNWLMVVQLIDAELVATEGAEARAALLLEKATLLEERLSREEDAARAYQECIALAPTDGPVLFQLESVFSAKGEHATLVQIYRLLAAGLKDDALRAHYLTAAGLILEARLGRPEDAGAAFREAFALDRKSPLLLAAVARVAERDGKQEELLAALAAEAELLGAQAAPAYLRIAKVYEALSRPEDALAALLAARRVDPNEPLILSELAQVYEARDRSEDLADVLLSWLSAVSDEQERVAINLRLAALYEEDLKRDDDAIGRYRAILDQVPGHSGALAGLGKLYYRTKNWEGLVGAYDAEIASLGDPKQQAAKMFRAAEILEERLGKQEEAIARYNRCLQLLPGYLPAQKALTRLFEKEGRFADLAQVYEQDLLQTQDKDLMVSTLNKIAALYEERLRDLDRAAEALRRILEISPDDLVTLRNLARLLERAGNWRELIQLHESQATLVGDTKEVLSLHHRNAEILEEQLKDQPGAVAAYERVLQLSPAYLPALKALGRLYAQEGRWEDLIRMYRAEAEIAPSTDLAAALIHKIGELYEQRLGNEAEAIAAYQEVLTLAPSYFPALRALARMHRAKGAWESLIEVLRAEAAARAEPKERANALFQAGAIWEERLDRADLAAQGYQDVLKLVPGHPAALRALERLYQKKNDTPQLVEVMDRETQSGQSPGLKVAAYVKLAYLFLDRLNDPAKAAQCAENALTLEPGNLAALKALERVRANDRVRRSEVRQRLAEAVADVHLKSAIRLTAAADREATTGLDGVLSDLKEAVASNPGDPRLSLSCERALTQLLDWNGLVDVLKARRGTLSDPMERVSLTLRMGEIAETKLKDARAALAAYQEALKDHPELLLALQGVRRCAQKLGDWGQVQKTYEAEGKYARDARSAIDAFVGAGQVAADKLQDADGAIASFRKALERDPLDPAATRGIEDLLAKRGGAQDLATLQERRGEAKLAQKDLPAAATEFFQASRTYLDKLNDRARALTMVDRALAAQPTHPDALEMKGGLALGAQQYADAAAAYGLRVQQGGDARLLAALHLTLGSLYQDHLNDPTRAAAHLQTALASDARSLQAMERLAQIHTASRNWTGAADCLKRLLEIDMGAPERARHTLALARVYDEGLSDQKEASTLYRRALDLAPADAQVIDRLIEIYERMGALPDLVLLLEQQARAAGANARGLSIQLKVADIHRRVNDTAKAIAAYRKATELDPGCVPARAALADLYMRDAAAGPMAVEEHRALLRLDAPRPESVHALFRLWDGGRQADRALCAASILTFLRSANDAEAALYGEAKGRLPQDLKQVLEPEDEVLLMHPAARGHPLVDVLRAVGDQLTKLYPPQFEALGVDRKADRLKADHAVHRAIRSVAAVLGVDDFDVYQAKRGLVTLETSEPLAICVSQDVVRKFNAREQKFLIARALLGIKNRTAVLSKLSTAEAQDLFGSAVRIFHPQYTQLGRPNEELTRQLRKVMSRRALKALEGPAGAVAELGVPDVARVAEGLALSADRAGLLLSGDVASALNVLWREDPAVSNVRPEGAEPTVQLVRSRADMRELLAFSLSEEFFRLRERAGVGL